MAKMITHIKLNTLTLNDKALGYRGYSSYNSDDDNTVGTALKILIVNGI